MYELRGQAWEDRGTGFVEGIYDEASDEALLVVTREDTAAAEQTEQGGQPDPEEEPVGPGGFLREGEDPFLLRSRVGKTEQYSRQQGETSVVFSLHREDTYEIASRNIDCLDGIQWDGRRAIFPGPGRLQ